MKLTWRRLRPGELDHELLWLSVSVAAALIAWFWLSRGIPTPKCVWHEITGVACPGCGATRATRFLLQGAWTDAIRMNPLFVAVACFGVLFDLYAAVVLIFRLPRLRFDSIPEWLGWTARFGIPALIVINWGWLVITKV